MGKKISLRRYLAPALAAAVFLMVGSAAQAAVWVGSWDPKYGAPFEPPGLAYDLGWGGEIKVNDDACTVVPASTISNAGSCGGGAFVVPGSLFVRLYAHPSLTPVYNTIFFSAASLTIDQLRYDSNGVLTGISTTSLSNWVYDSMSLSPPNGAGTDSDFALQFVLDGLPCIDCTFFGPLPVTYDGPVLFARKCPDCDNFRSDVVTYPAEIRFTPEPASVLLVAAGLLAAGFARRHGFG